MESSDGKERRTRKVSGIAVWGDDMIGIERNHHGDDGGSVIHQKAHDGVSNRGTKIDVEVVEEVVRIGNRS